MNSRTQIGRILSAVALLAAVNFTAQPSLADDAPLQAQQAQTDTGSAKNLDPSPTPAQFPGQSPASGALAPLPSNGARLHKLGASTSVLHTDDNSGGTTLKDFPDTPSNHPFAGLRSIFGKHGLKSSAFAERDTGYGVCGLVLSVTDRGFVQIRQVFPSMPAATAGILPGDSVISVDGQSTEQMTQSEVWNYFTGAPNSRVIMQVARQGMKLEVAMQRMDIGHIPDPLTRAVFLDSFRKNGPSRFYRQEP